MASETVLLTSISAGRQVLLVSFNSGARMRQRLKDMGLYEGMKFTVMQVHKFGPCVVRIGSGRLVLGHSMASKIMVKE